jgi:hypothetical protein
VAQYQPLLGYILAMRCILAQCVVFGAMPRVTYQRNALYLAQRRALHISAMRRIQRHC